MQLNRIHNVGNDNHLSQPSVYVNLVNVSSEFNILSLMSCLTGWPETISAILSIKSFEQNNDYVWIVNAVFHVIFQVHDSTVYVSLYDDYSSIVLC